MSRMTFKKYGNSPSVVLVHGGPGAAGEMTPVAEELSAKFDILEPWQTARTIEGQVEELAKIIKNEAVCPVILMGFSWGAWLICFVAAQYPDIVKKLVLISSAPFEQSCADVIQQKRFERMNAADRQKVRLWTRELQDITNDHRDEILLEIGLSYEKADTFIPLQDVKNDIEFDANIYRQIWPQATQWRREGRLLDLREKIQCPVVALHGDYDPHPAQGVFEPLKHLASFRFIVLSQCGHKPWVEKLVRERFYDILRDIIDEA